MRKDVNLNRNFAPKVDLVINATKSPVITKKKKMDLVPQKKRFLSINPSVQ